MIIQMGKATYKEVTAEQKKNFAPYLAEDEELVIATGFGKNYIRHRFAYYLIFPGGIAILGAVVYCYLYGTNYGYGLLVGLLAAMVIAYIKSIWTYHANRYLLTTRRVIVKKGFFAVKLTSALYDKITHIEVDQTLFDRLVMRHGNIIINTAGANKDEIKLNFVDSPIELKNMLERLINRERERFGGQTGPVVTLEGEIVDD